MNLPPHVFKGEPITLAEFLVYLLDRSPYKTLREAYADWGQLTYSPYERSQRDARFPSEPPLRRHVRIEHPSPNEQVTDEPEPSARHPQPSRSLRLLWLMRGRLRSRMPRASVTSRNGRCPDASE